MRAKQWHRMVVMGDTATAAGQLQALERLRGGSTASQHVRPRAGRWWQGTGMAIMDGSGMVNLDLVALLTLQGLDG